MLPDWQRIDDLLGGTQAMREAGETYLPQETGETPLRYNARLARTFLFPALSNTREKLIEKPFAKPTGTRGDIPPLMEDVIDNVDLGGASMTMLAKWLLGSGLNYGRSHLFVDFQTTGGTQTALDERVGKVRPYMIRVSARDLIDWSEVQSSTGRSVINEVRWLETATVRDENDPWVSRVVERVRRYTAEEVGGRWVATWSVYERAKAEDGWPIVPTDSGPFVWGGEGLPFFTFNPWRGSDRFATTPPLRDLSWLSIEHWQSSSDYRQALRFAALIMLVGRGLDAEKAKTGLALGHGAFHGFTSDTAKLEWVEAEGHSIAHLRVDLDRIAEAMEMEGMQPFMRKRANTTATSQRSNDTHNEAPIQAWVREANTTLTNAVKAAAKFLGIDMPEDFQVEIFNDFSVIESGDADALIKLRQLSPPGIDHETFIREMQRLGKLSDELEPADIVEAVKREMEDMPGATDVVIDGVPDDPDDPDLGVNEA
jgi:hypothetical protein